MVCKYVDKRILEEDQVREWKSRLCSIDKLSCFHFDNEALVETCPLRRQREHKLNETNARGQDAEAAEKVT